MNILVIEDERRFVEILVRALKIQHYSVDLAFDGKDGLKKALKNNYDLILLDVMLPEKDGFTVCKKIREKNTNTPIIILTARGTKDDKIKGLNVGADDYMVKPFSIEELLNRIKTILERKIYKNAN